MSSFRKNVDDWLSPIGFQPIYSINHPTDTYDSIHYIKNETRVCIEMQDDDIKYYVLNVNIILVIKFNNGR